MARSREAHRLYMADWRARRRQDAAEFEPAAAEIVTGRQGRVGRHLRAVNRTARALGADRDPVQSAMLGLARTLGRQLDAQGDAMSLTLLLQYRDVAKELRDVSDVAPEPDLSLRPPSLLDEMRARVARGGPKR